MNPEIFFGFVPELLTGGIDEQRSFRDGEFQKQEIW